MRMQKYICKRRRKGYKIERPMKGATNKHTEVVGYFRRLWNISIANDGRQ